MCDAYFWLIQKIADAEPVTGYYGPEQMDLEPTDLPVVVQNEPGLVSEVFDEWHDRRIVREILPALRTGDTMELGRIFQREIKRLCERNIYLPVSDECDRRDAVTTQEREQRHAADAVSMPHYGRPL